MTDHMMTRLIDCQSHPHRLSDTRYQCPGLPPWLDSSDQYGCGKCQGQSIPLHHSYHSHAVWHIIRITQQAPINQSIYQSIILSITQSLSATKQPASRAGNIDPSRKEQRSKEEAKRREKVESCFTPRNCVMWLHNTRGSLHSTPKDNYWTHPYHFIVYLSLIIVKQTDVKLLCK